MSSHAQQAQTLVEALPYIQRFWDKTVVVKYGGAAMTDPRIKATVMQDIALMKLVGMHPVVVHGGGPEINANLKKMQIESHFVDGLRVTDQETVEAAQMVLCGKISKSLVNLLQCYGGKAMGLSGLDGHMILAKQKDTHLGFVGEITKVDPQPILDVLDAGSIPVVSTKRVRPGPTGLTPPWWSSAGVWLGPAAAPWPLRATPPRPWPGRT